MTNVDKPEPGNPIVVTGEERAHPAIRLLARAAIDLARQQITQSKQQESANDQTSEHGDGNAEPVLRGSESDDNRNEDDRRA